MKKHLFFALMCVFVLFSTLKAQEIVTIGGGEEVEGNFPFNDSYSYSLSQQIYTADELTEVGSPAAITNIAFKSATELSNNTVVTVFMQNTDKSSFEDETDWYAISQGDKVFEGTFSTTGLDKWCGIELDIPFLYTGGNILLSICTNIIDYSPEEVQDELYVYPSTTSDIVSLYARVSEKINPYDLLEDFTGSVGNTKNQIQLTVSTKQGIVSNLESINLGDIALGKYWSEKEKAQAFVTVASENSTITNVVSDNPFFVLPSEIDYSGKAVKFTVTYDGEAEAGEKSGNLTITDGEGATAVIPMTAKAYTLATPDVFEHAQEVTFTENTYTDTPDFATLHDDYVLPNEALESNAPDAVYAIELEKSGLLLVDVKGEKSKYALYTEDFYKEGGPKADNAFSGEETIISTTFLYDFEDNSLNDFILINYDEFESYNWKIEGNNSNRYLTSYSYIYLGGNPQYINNADERIMTKKTHTITPNSVLTFYITKGHDDFEEVIVEITKDGENFIELETVKYHDYTSDWLLCRIDFNEKFTALGLEYGDYQIVLHHKLQGVGQLVVDNFRLTERTTIVPSGKYYLVAAAEEEFTVNISIGDIPQEPVAPAVPEVTATANSMSSITLTWNAVANATSYNIYQGTEKLANVTETSFTIDGLDAESYYCYTVTAVNDNSESDYSEEACATTLSDGITELECSINIYPNPVENELFLATEVRVEEVSIYDIYGRKTTDYRLRTTGFIHSVNVAELEAGVYFVNIKTDNGEIIKRFIKK